MTIDWPHILLAVLILALAWCYIVISWARRILPPRNRRDK